MTIYGIITTLQYYYYSIGTTTNAENACGRCGTAVYVAEKIVGAGKV